MRKTVETILTHAYNFLIIFIMCWFILNQIRSIFKINYNDLSTSSWWLTVGSITLMFGLYKMSSDYNTKERIEKKTYGMIGRICETMLNDKFDLENKIKDLEIRIKKFETDHEEDGH